MTDIIAKDAKLAKFTKEILMCFFAIIVLRQAQDDPEQGRGVVSFENFAVDPWPRGIL